jgi:hypothetical protein
MFEITLNSESLRNQLGSALMALQDSDAMLSVVATSMVPVLRKRVHEDGLDASGNAIGTYSKEYMSVRTGIYKSNGVYKSGPKKGERKPQGVYTKGKKKGEPRPQYNRTSDTKIILSLTRQAENDMKAIPTPIGWGIGYSNPDNYDKIVWNEKRYGKKILTALTDEEDKQVEEIALKYVDNIINKL